MTHQILWGHEPNALTFERAPATTQAAWAQYRALSATHYAALIVEGETVAHNLSTGPVIANTRGLGDSDTNQSEDK